MNEWPPFQSILADLPVPTGYQLAQIGAEDVREVIALMERWYPDVTVGAESCHLREGFYLEKVQLREVSERRSVYGIIIKRGNEIVGLGTFERDDDAKFIFGHLGAIAPEHRGGGLASTCTEAFERMARAIGAELMIWTATLKHPYSQRMAEAAGYELAGIIPGFDRDMIEPGLVKRVYEAVYVKLLVPEAALQKPSRQAMTPKVRELFDHLFTPAAASD